ncbi:lipoprotein, putative [Leucobacter sp. 7(1)]|uniref:DUF4822 domain-containing protein n=1 Tax=Leucobacter sp. 7(1) TaxID=1255613 RepID=UPI00097F29B3|nr:DUF4822 domain-containing protein [Leucobacter sp. 7(1)]SJN08749.1 lipoprotein, putative [Leucobacter sp. 7(1)]
MPAHAPSYFSPAPIVDKTRHHRSRRAVLSSAAFAAALCVFPVSAAFAADPGPQPVTATDIASVSAAPAQLLASTAWETTGAVDQNGAPVALDDPAVRNFVGWAYYNTDGTFTMYNLDDTPKMQGDWEVSPDGTTRTLVAKDATGTTLFTRVVPITVLTAEEFTYRIVPDTAQPDVYVDIIHTPTTHTEPGTVDYSQLLASTAWETTGAVDQNGAPVALDDPAVRNFVGWAYYNTDGTFTMYNLDDTPKMQGDWEVSPDGTTRTLVAKDATGTTLFTRVVPITVLTAEEFTYRIVPDTAQPDVYVDIIHTPTTHTEPGTVTTDPEPEPEPTDPGTTDPGTTDPGTTDPGTTGPGTTDPGTSTEEPAVPQGDPRSPSKPATTAGGAKAPEQLAVTGADIPALAGVAAAALALLGGTTAVVARVLRRAQ